MSQSLINLLTVCDVTVPISDDSSVHPTPPLPHFPFFTPPPPRLLFSFFLRNSFFCSQHYQTALRLDTFCLLNSQQYMDHELQFSPEVCLLLFFTNFGLYINVLDTKYSKKTAKEAGLTTSQSWYDFCKDLKVRTCLWVFSRLFYKFLNPLVGILRLLVTNHWDALGSHRQCGFCLTKLCQSKLLSDEKVTEFKSPQYSAS